MSMSPEIARLRSEKQKALHDKQSAWFDYATARLRTGIAYGNMECAKEKLIYAKEELNKVHEENINDHNDSNFIEHLKYEFLGAKVRYEWAKADYKQRKAERKLAKNRLEQVKVCYKHCKEKLKRSLVNQRRTQV